MIIPPKHIHPILAQMKQVTSYFHSSRGDSVHAVKRRSESECVDGLNKSTTSSSSSSEVAQLKDFKDRVKKMGIELR